MLISTPPVSVTRPSLPPLEDFVRYLEQIWQSKVITNNGSLHERLEAELCDYLGVPHLSLFCNGTIALITALKALDIQGEVITTPYTFAATAHALVWNDLDPVFVDIDAKTLNLDPEQIERSITPQTAAILPVHVYGQPCDIEAIDAIARKHDLRVIYDAAHAFNVQCHSASLLNHGDLSILSFHATKVFNTGEGGAIVSRNPDTKRYIDRLRNFGFGGETIVDAVGINGKMSELSSALGLAQLPYIGSETEKRQSIDALYRERLTKVEGIRCHRHSGVRQQNYGYFPIFVEPNYPLSRDGLYKKLKANGIQGRRYFFPLVPDFEVFKTRGAHQSAHLEVARKTADQVICLPIYADLDLASIEKISRLVAEN